MNMKRTPLKRKTPLRRKSKKRVALDKERSEFVRVQLAKRPWCEAGLKIGRHLYGGRTRYTECSLRSTELHEPLTRARAPGRDTILDIENSVSICRGCHSWVHEHPKDATKIDLLVSSWGRR